MVVFLLTTELFLDLSVEMLLSFRNGIDGADTKAAASQLVIVREYVKEERRRGPLVDLLAQYRAALDVLLLREGVFERISPEVAKHKVQGQLDLLIGGML